MKQELSLDGPYEDHPERLGIPPFAHAAIVIVLAQSRRQAPSTLSIRSSLIRSRKRGDSGAGVGPGESESTKGAFLVELLHVGRSAGSS